MYFNTESIFVFGANKLYSYDIVSVGMEWMVQLNDTIVSGELHEEYILVTTSTSFVQISYTGQLVSYNPNISSQTWTYAFSKNGMTKIYLGTYFPANFYLVSNLCTDSISCNQSQVCRYPISSF